MLLFIKVEEVCCVSLQMEAHRQQRDVRTFQPKPRYIIRSPLIHVCNNISILNFAVLFLWEEDI